MPIAAFTPAPPPPAGGLQQYHTMNELAAALRVTIATVRAWVKAKRLPHPIRIGRSLRFEAEAVRAALEKVAQEGDGDAA
jgi:excisionase family DNA binding protein